MTVSPLRGVALVLAAAALWGTTGTAQSLAPPQLASVWVGALRLAVAGLFFGAWLAMARARRGASAPTLAPLSWPLVIAAAACMAAYNLAFFAGVRALGVAVGTALAIGSSPLWGGLLQGVFARRAPVGAWWLGTVLAVTGGVLLVGEGAQTATVSVGGVLACLGAGLSYAAFALLNHGLVARADPGRVTGAVFTLAALLAVPAAVALAGVPHIGVRDLAIVAWLGVASTGVAYLLFSHGLRHISGATGVALALFEPVTAFALAVVVVGERPGLMAVLGLLGVLAGLALVVRAEMR
ncbi:MAG: EamA family transporter [Rhodoferax sp.]|nr:EamA family transporter [Rhodoferax sp.]